MKNIFGATKEYPFHLSIGAVLINDKGKICTHFFKKGDLDHESEEKSDLWLLMRETPHSGESIEETVTRGLMEEFGARGEIRHYLGAIESWFPGITTGITLYKTTLYFLVTLTDIDFSRREGGAVESRSEVLWKEPEELVKLFKEQGTKYERTDLDESGIVKNYIEYAKD